MERKYFNNNLGFYIYKRSFGFNIFKLRFEMGGFSGNPFYFLNLSILEEVTKDFHSIFSFHFLYFCIGIYWGD